MFVALGNTNTMTKTRLCLAKKMQYSPLVLEAARSSWKAWRPSSTDLLRVSRHSSLNMPCRDGCPDTPSTGMPPSGPHSSPGKFYNTRRLRGKGDNPRELLTALERACLFTVDSRAETILTAPSKTAQHRLGDGLPCRATKLYTGCVIWSHLSLTFDLW